ncbi:hypothetical protein AF72_12880 [Xylella taiwanensis]|uniref:Uncharacterized protein n=1 Tax=Xylella taiwanensis TaxID=1444770 RepID=Z9JGD8_9GAMM|nr:hypothetical protein AF72_12880 [Xylella taiwanensis]
MELIRSTNGQGCKSDVHRIGVSQSVVCLDGASAEPVALLCEVLPVV